MKTIIIIFFLNLLIIPSNAQELENGAFSSPNGIYVYTGNFIASASKPYNNITEFRIERKETNENNWDLVAEFASPQTFDEFKQNLSSALKEMPMMISLSDIPADEIWEKIMKYGITDSVGIWGLSLPVQRALGIVFLDKSVVNKGKYTYRVSYLSSNGSVSGSTEYSPSYYPPKKKPINIDVLESDFDYNRIDILLSAPAASGIRMLKVFRKDDIKGEPEEVNCGLSVYYSNDSVYMSVSDTSIELNKNYEYVLQPFDRFGNPGGYTPPLPVATYNINESINIRNLNAEPVTSSGSINLSWSSSGSENISSIKIFKSADMDTGYYQIAELPATDTEFTDVNTAPKKMYYYYISCTDLSGGISANSGKVFAIVEYSQPPSRPYIAGSESLKDGIKIYFSASDDNIKGFRIYRDNGIGDSFVQISSLIPYKDSLISYTDTSSSLSGALQYRYAVMSVSLNGVLSDTSNIISERPDKPVYPSAPAELKANVREKSTWLYWKDMNNDDYDIMGYSIFRRQISENGKPVTEFQPLVDTTKLIENNNYVDSSVVPGTSYQYAVQSVNIYGGRSSLSYPVTVRIEITRDNIIPPSGLHAQVVPEGIMLQWGKFDSKIISEFRIYRNKRGEEPTPVASVKSNQYLDRNVSKGELYFYHITSLGKGGKESIPGEEISIRP